MSLLHEGTVYKTTVLVPLTFFQFTHKNLFHSGNTSTCYKPPSPTCFHRVYQFNATTATCFYTDAYFTWLPAKNHDSLKL